MNTAKEISDRELVRRIARKDGTHLKPSEYITIASKSPYNREVSNATVTRSVGSYANRLSTDLEEAAFIAKKLLKYCKHDLSYAEHVLHKSYLQ